MKAMRVNNLHVSSLGVTGAWETSRTEPSRSPTSTPERPPVESSFHTPSPELTYWLSQVGREPELRADVLERVTQLLSTGYYLSPEAARLTAAALLNAMD